jgi:hypothetical protein
MSKSYSAYSPSEVVYGLAAIIFVTVSIVGSMAAWVTHVIATIQAGSYILLAVGAFIAPIGVIHGIMIWFGVPWGG